RLYDEDIIPLNQVEPVYPTRAAQRKIEGWVQVQFTVTAAGTVDPLTIEVVDADPPGLFDNSAQRATAEMLFSPRIRNGTPVDVPGVQYVWRYMLSKESE